ncbi:MAG TPA: hypothetical protein P5077_05305 [bacterium]|nr:hypothetical protein [bacterium]
MKVSPRTPYNIAFALILLTAVWSVFSFFSYHIAPLPERMPGPLLDTLSREVRPGEPIYLADQRFDRFVGSHPQYNIFPGGGSNAPKAARASRFFLVVGASMPGDFGDLDGFSATVAAAVEGLTLWRFERTDGAPAEYLLSDAFPDGLVIRSSAFPDGAAFRNGEFVIGPAPWERAQVKSGEFGPERRTALSVHPLDGPDKWIELTADPARWRAAAISLGYGIAASGDCKGQCPPVTVTVTQEERERSFTTRDGVWQQAELKGFAADRPLTIRVVADKAGKRHFYCDLIFRAAGEVTP